MKSKGLRILRDSEGKGLFGCMVLLVVFIAVVFVAIKLAPLYYSNYNMESDLKTEVSRAGAHSFTDDQIVKDILDLAKKIREAINDNVSIKFCPLPADDPKRRRPDIKRAENILYWHPIVGLDQGLLRTIEWFRRQRTNLQTTQRKKLAHKRPL